MAIKTTHSHTHHPRPRTAPKTRAPIDLSAPVRAVLFDIDGTLLDTRDAMAHQLVQEIVPGDRDLVFPGVREGLDELRAQGVKLAAVTSSVSCPEVLAATVPTWVVSSFCQIGALLSGRIATPA